MTNLRLGHRVHVSILRGELMSTNIPPKKHCQKHNFLKIISFTLTVSNGKNLEIETPPAKESFLATPLTESQGKEQLGLHKVKKYWISKYFLKKERFWLSVPSLREVTQFSIMTPSKDPAIPEDPAIPKGHTWVGKPQWRLVVEGRIAHCKDLIGKTGSL